MKFSICLLTILLLGASACPDKSKNQSNNKNMNTIEGTWYLTKIEIDKKGESNPYEKTKTVVLTFEEGEEQGKVSGKDICGNRVFGNYELAKDQTIEVLRFGGTKKGCRGWASDFWGLFRKSQSIELDGETLKIFLDNSASFLEFEKGEPLK